MCGFLMLFNPILRIEVCQVKINDLNYPNCYLLDKS